MTWLALLFVLADDGVILSARANAGVVGIAQPVTFSCRAREDILDRELSWTLSRIEREGKRIIHRAVGRTFTIAPRETGSYLAEVTHAFSRQRRACSIEVIRLARPFALSQGEPIASETIDALAGQPVRIQVDANLKLRGGIVRWSIEGLDTSRLRDTTVEIVFPNPGRFHIQAFVGASASPPLQFVVRRDLPVTITRFDPLGRRTVALADDAFVGSADRVTVSVDASSAVSWQVAMSDGTRLSAKGATAQLVGLRPGTLEIRASVGAARTAPIRLRCVGAEFVDKDGRRIERLGFCRWFGAFDQHGQVVPSFPTLDPDRFSVRIQDPTGFPLTDVQIVSLANDAVVDGPVTHTLSQKLETSAMALVFDPVDDAYTALGIPDNAPNDPTLLAALDGNILVVYRGVVCASVKVGPARPTTCPLSFTVLRTRSNGPVLADARESIEKRVAYLNAYFSQAAIRFVIRTIETIDPPDGLLVVSGTASGTDLTGAPARLTLRVDDHPMTFRTTLGTTPGQLAQRVALELMDRHAVNILPPLGICRREHVALLLRDGELSVDREVYDLGQSASSFRVDLSDGITIGSESGELSMEELCLMAHLKESKGIRIVVANSLVKRDTPLCLGNSTGAFVIVDARAIEADRYPFVLAKQILFALLGKRIVELAPTALNGTSDPETNTLNSGKRLSEALVRALEHEAH